MKKIKEKCNDLFFVLSVLTLPLLCSCAVAPDPVCVKARKSYCKASGNFTGQWYDYYERGLSCMEGECYEAALSDLDNTLKGRFEDQRMARTFGMHFVDYFPHREKGLIHYLMGNYDAAKSELELSIKQYPSEKAFFYLDKVRKHIMEKEKQPLSVPRVILDSPLNEFDEIWTKADPVVISGRAEDEQYVSEISLKHKPFFIERSGQVVTFRNELTLAEGKHEIDIMAKNLLGGTAKQRLIFCVDRSGPVIILTKPDTGGKITGWLYDESGEIRFASDGENVPVPKGKKVPFSVPVKAGQKYITLLAKDKLGNQTEAVVNGDMAILADARGTQPLLAQIDVVTDSGADVFGSAINNSKQIKPEIIVQGWPDQKTVFLERIYIKGYVKGENNIESLTVNNMPVLTHPGQVIFFNRLKRLKSGKNTITIRAEDEFGNVTVKEIFIHREVPQVFKPNYRYCLAMHLFDSLEDGPSGKQTLFQHLFLKRLVDHNRFQILLRQELKTFFSEYKNDVVFSEDAAFEQKGLTPDAALLGSVYKTRNGIEIVARFVDVKTGEILAIKDVYSESEDRPTLASMAEKLAEKFHRTFPLMDARITQIEKGRFTMASEKWIPEKGEITMKWPLIIYRKTEPEHNPITGNSLGSDTKIIGDARVEGIAEDNYLAAPLNGQEFERIKQGDRVITR